MPAALALLLTLQNLDQRRRRPIQARQTEYSCWVSTRVSSQVSIFYSSSPSVPIRPTGSRSRLRYLPHSRFSATPVRRCLSTSTSPPLSSYHTSRRWILNQRLNKIRTPTRRWIYRWSVALLSPLWALILLSRSNLSRKHWKLVEWLENHKTAWCVLKWAWQRQNRVLTRAFERRRRIRLRPCHEGRAFLGKIQYIETSFPGCSGFQLGEAYILRFPCFRTIAILFNLHSD